MVWSNRSDVLRPSTSLAKRGVPALSRAQYEFLSLSQVAAAQSPRRPDFPRQTPS